MGLANGVDNCGGLLLNVMWNLIEQWRTGSGGKFWLNVGGIEMAVLMAITSFVVVVVMMVRKGFIRGDGGGCGVMVVEWEQ